MSSRPILLTLILTAALGACGTPELEPTAVTIRTPSPSSTPTTTQTATAEPSPAAVSRNVVLYDYRFQPASFEVPSGAEVSVYVVNDTNHEHSWALMEKDYVPTLPVDADDSEHILHYIVVDVGWRETLAFTAPEEPGVYVIVCSLPNHAEQGMVGTLVVR